MKKRIIGLSLFAVVFGYLEADVVTYLRYLYYEDPKILFPLKMMDPEIFVFEILRELSTLLIITLVSYLSSREKEEIFYLWIFTFGVWDIFYYIFLFLMIRWPSSIFSFDLLFLIPSLWIAPIICPILVSLVFILGGLYNLFKKKRKMKINLLLGIFGGVLILISFLYKSLILKDNIEKVAFPSSINQFPWQFFLPGFFLLSLALFIRKR
ncbi:MAG: hypothetical protein ABIN61_08520 [candidate division WOR-3 bacterium]